MKMSIKANTITPEKILNIITLQNNASNILYFPILSRMLKNRQLYHLFDIYPIFFQNLFNIIIHLKKRRLMRLLFYLEDYLFNRFFAAR